MQHTNWNGLAKTKVAYPNRKINSYGIHSQNLLKTKLPNQRIWNYGNSERRNHKTSSDTIGHQDLKMKDIIEQSINPPFIMKQRDQTHTWCNYPFLHIFFQFKQTKHSWKGVLYQVELHPRGTDVTSGGRIKSVMIVR